MGFLEAIKQLAFSFLVAFNWVYPSLFRHAKLHAARFARIDELANSNQETADYLERCLGRTSEYAHSQTVRDGTKTSQGLVEQGVPLLTAGE